MIQHSCGFADYDQAVTVEEKFELPRVGVNAVAFGAPLPSRCHRRSGSHTLHGEEPPEYISTASPNLQSILKRSFVSRLLCRIWMRTKVLAEIALRDIGATPEPSFGAHFLTTLWRQTSFRWRSIPTTPARCSTRIFSNSPPIASPPSTPTARLEGSFVS